MRARQNFFKHHLFHEILHLLCTFKILISFKFIPVVTFEHYVFSWKILNFFLKISKFFKFSKFLKKIEFSKKNFKLQIALKNSLFELWPNKKICNEILSWILHFQKNFWRARISARGARRISHRCENSKIMVFWHRW